MSLDLLFPHFETLIRTPEDVARLNQAILALAVQGKLVPQDPTDEPASELLKRIRAEKRRLVKEGKLQESKPLPVIVSTDTPFDLPQGWVWTRLGNLVELEYGKGLPQKTRADDGSIPVYGSNGIVGCHSEALVGSPCVVIGRKGSSGAVNLSPVACWVIDTAYYTLPPNDTDLGFIFRLMQSLKLDKLGKGIKPGLNRNEAYSLILGLPPLAEQRRIVAKVESLFAQTRALEAKLRQARADLVTVNRAALHRLSVAADADAFVAAWTTVRDAFDLLYADPRNVAELRRAILQLAVQGKLVPQDPADEPASELLKRIREQRRRLVEAGKAVDTKPLPPIPAKQVPHEIAKNWKWVRLAEIAEVIMGQSPPGDSYNSDGEGVPLINGPVEFSSGPFGETQKTKFTTTPTKMCQSGDLLICVRGSTTGRTNVAAFDACIGRGVAAIRTYVSQEYLNNFVLSQRQIIYDLGTGSTFPSVSQDRIRELLVPLPPLAEQRRIVAKVDQLMRLCDALEAGLARAEGQRRGLVAAVLGGAA